MYYLLFNSENISSTVLFFLRYSQTKCIFSENVNFFLEDKYYFLLLNVTGIIIAPVVFLRTFFSCFHNNMMHKLYFCLHDSCCQKFCISFFLQLRGTSVFTAGFRPSPWRSTSAQCCTPATPPQTWLWTDTTATLSAEASSTTTRSPRRCCSASASAPWRPAVTAWW